MRNSKCVNYILSNNNNLEKLSICYNLLKKIIQNIDILNYELYDKNNGFNNEDLDIGNNNYIKYSDYEDIVNIIDTLENVGYYNC